MTHLPPRRLLIRNGNCLEPCQEPLQPPTKGYATRGGKRAPRRHPRRFQGPQVTAKPRQMAPRWSPRRTKRPFQSTLNIKIAKCHRTLLFTMFYTHPGTPGTTNFPPFWEPKCSPNAGPNIYVKKVSVNGSKARHDQPKVTQRWPKSTKMGPRWGPKVFENRYKSGVRSGAWVWTAFWRHFGALGCPCAAWLPNPSKIISRHYTRTCFPEHQIRNFAVASPFRMETKTNVLTKSGM